MAIYRLIANGAFGPDEIEVMTLAYEGALTEIPVALERLRDGLARLLES